MTTLTVVNKVVVDDNMNHAVGNFYISNYGTLCVLACVGYHKVCLINTNGSRWVDAKVVVNISNITPTEFNLITEGEPFTKIEFLTITLN